jgi:hypothetical protein
VGSEKSVSHLKRALPSWASLPGDLIFQQPSSIMTLPSELLLDGDSSCPCCTEKCFFFRPLDRAAISKRAATIYGLSMPTSVALELQSCMCKRRFIGPDCRSLGIFNYNNKVLFTHEILDEYTAAFTTSETPFSAWVIVVSCRYSLRGFAFCSVETFWSAWFAYVKLLYLEGDMCCPKCGPSPENTIWDGMTLAFNQKHLLSSLEPPTISQPSPIVRDRTQYISGQQTLPDSYT